MASSEEILRILLQDPVGADSILTSADYIAIVALEENAYRAASVGATTIAAKFADLINMKASKSALNLSEKYEHYIKLAKEYAKRAQEGGDGGTGVVGLVVGSGPELNGISIGEMESVDSNTDRYDSAFVRGQDSNPPSINPAFNGWEKE